MRRNEYELAVWRHPLGADLRWADARGLAPEDKEGRWLVSAKPPEETKKQFPILDESPAADHDLFLRFSDLEETESAILGFAKKNGFLTGAGTNVLVRGSGRSSTAGERLEDWIEEIRSMRDARDLALALEKEDKDKLRKWLDIEPRAHSHSYVSFDGDAGSTEGLWAGVRENRWIRAGKLVLAHRINKKLSGQADIMAVVRNHRLERQVKLWSLRTEMWIQLLDSYADHRFYYCEACGKRNVLRPQEHGKRKPNRGRTLCIDEKSGRTSPKCKSLAHRQRQAKKKASVRKDKAKKTGGRNAAKKS